MAISATTVWEVRTTGSDTACGGGFDSTLGGTDYSQQNTAQATGTATSTSTTVTATSGIFTAAMVGNIITDGTIRKQITGYTSSIIVTVDSAPSWTAATIYVGGAVASLGIVGGAAVNGNVIWVGGGTYSMTSASSNVSGGNFSNQRVSILGYNATRDDWGTSPIIQAAVTSGNTMVTSNEYFSMRNITLDANGKYGSVLNTNGEAFLIDCLFKSWTSGVGINANGNPLMLKGCTSISAAISTSHISNANRITADDCTFEFGQYAINYGGGGTSEITDCIFSGQTTQSIVCNAANQIDIKNCTFYNCAIGVNLGVNNGWAVTQIQNCYFEGSSGNAIDASGVISTANSYTARIRNNSFYNNGGKYNTTNIPSASVTGNITCTASALNNPGSGDFSLNNMTGGGALVRASGYQSNNRGLSVGYPDGGAIQHKASGGISRSRIMGGV